MNCITRILIGLLTGATLAFAQAQRDLQPAEETTNVLRASQYAGANAGVRIAAAIADLSAAGGTIDARDIEGPQTFSQSVEIDRPVRLILGSATFTTTASDAGQYVGSMFKITSDDVSIEGQGPATILRKTGASNQQALISLAANSRITIKNLKLDGDEANHSTQTSHYYTLIVSRAGSSDIRIENVELTGGGNRAIDLRGCNRVWIKNNYFHQNGIATIGGTPLDGNALSIDADGATQPTDAWIEGNIVEEWGDSFSFVTGKRATFKGNILRGRADFGNTPLTTESGIDLTGSQDVTVEGNEVYNVSGSAISAIPQGSDVPHNITIINNIFSATAAGLSAYDPRINLGQGGISSQPTGFQFIGNKLKGVHVLAAGIDSFTFVGNTLFNSHASATANGGLELGQGAGGVMKNFVVANNTFDTDDATLVRGINVTSRVTTPGTSVIANNTFHHMDPTTAIKFQSGAASDKVVVENSRQEMIQ